MIRQVLVMAGVACTLSAAQAADIDPQQPPLGPLTLSGSLGYLTGVAHERVYDHGTKVSQLDWDMQSALVLNGGLNVPRHGADRALWQSVAWARWRQPDGRL